MLDVQLEECVFCCFWMECSVYSWSLNNMGLTCVGHLYIDFFFFFNYICRTLCARCTEVDSLSLHRHKVSGIYYETNVLVFSLLFNFAFKELYYYTVYLSCRVGNSNPFQYSCLETPVDRGAWWESHRVGQSWSALACMHTLEKELPTHSILLAWRIPGTEEPGGLPSVGLYRVGHNWSDLAAAVATSLVIGETA